MDWFWRENSQGSFEKVGDDVDLITDMPGEYHAVATNCLNNVIKSEEIIVESVPTVPPTTIPTTIVFGSTYELTGTAEPTVTPTSETETKTQNDFSNLSDNVDNKVCSAVGANIITFDGMTYGFSSTCTFVMAMDCFFGEWFIYIRFRPCLDNPFVNCFESVQITSNGQQIQLLRGWTINNNGFRLPYEKGQSFEVRGMSGYFDGYHLTITLSGSKVRVRFDGFSVVHVIIDNDVETCGICGDSDGKSGNDVEKGRPRYQTANELGNFLGSWKLRSKAHCRQSVTEVIDVVSMPIICPDRRDLVQRCGYLKKVNSFKRCISSSILNFLYHVCRHESCSGEEQLKGFPLTCAIGHAITANCKSQNQTWQETAMCKSEKDRIFAVKNWP